MCLSPLRIKPTFVPSLAAVGIDTAAPTHESGQLLMDKRRCIGALAAVTVLNSNAHRSLVYAGLHGDKDTFRCAFAALGTMYYALNVRPALGGEVLDPHSGVLHDSCFIQPGLDGRALFLHYCGRHRRDDAQRAGRPPLQCMTPMGRPFKLWPYDGRRGYMSGVVQPFNGRESRLWSGMQGLRGGG